MSKLTKSQSKLHNRSLALANLDRPLALDEREFILDNYHPGATHINTLSNAHFTPRSLACDLAIYIPDNGTTIDLCAGIGTLAYYALLRFQSSDYYRRNGHVPIGQIVCVELNPDYIAIGRKVVPEALWIQADVFNLPDCLTRKATGTPFDFAISNPPFGRANSKLFNLPAPGTTLDLNVLAVAAALSRSGAFILPQESCPFTYSGQQSHTIRPSKPYHQLKRTHDIDLTCSSIDCSIYRDDWRDVSPNVEIALWDLDEQEIESAQNVTTWANRVTVSRPDDTTTIYVFDTPTSAATFATYATNPTNKLDENTLFRAGLPLPLEIVKP